MPVIKTYSSAETAQKIAQKLFDKSGVPNQVLEASPGKFVITDVMVPAEHEKKEDAPSSNTVVMPGFGEVELKSVNPDPIAATVDVPEVVKVNATNTVTIEIPGAKLTAQYVITPVLGAKPRWFERKRMVSAEAISDGVRVTCSTKELTSRGLGHLLTQMDAKANATEPGAPAEVSPEVAAA